MCLRRIRTSPARYVYAPDQESNPSMRKTPCPSWHQRTRSGLANKSSPYGGNRAWFPAASHRNTPYWRPHTCRRNTSTAITRNGITIPAIPVVNSTCASKLFQSATLPKTSNKLAPMIDTSVLILSLLLFLKEDEPGVRLRFLWTAQKRALFYKPFCSAATHSCSAACCAALLACLRLLRGPPFSA